MMLSRVAYFFSTGVPICVADVEALLERGTKENGSLDRGLYPWVVLFY
jgi:hypothetical protein